MVSAMVVGHAVADLLVPAVFHHNVPSDTLAILWFGSSFGLVVAQIDLIALWAVLAPGRWIVRFPWAALLTAVLWLGLVLGNKAFANGISSSDVVVLGTVLFGAVLAGQLPLWVFGRGKRWRLLPPGENVAESQFNLRQLLLGVSLCAVTFALVRPLLLGSPQEVPRFDRELSVLLPLVTAVNFFVAVPAIWMAFWPVERLAAVAILAPLVLVFATAVELQALCALLRPLPRPEWIEAYLMMIAFNASQLLVVGLTLGLLRGMGFRLRRSNRNSPADRGT